MKGVGQSESRSLGRNCCRRKTEKRRWLDRVRVDLQGRDCWRRKAEKKVVGQNESGSLGEGLLGEEG